MRVRFLSQVMLGTLLSCQFSICLAADTGDPGESSKYLDAVREFADNVLKYGRDTYGPKHTPLFVDGLNTHTREPVKWIDPNGTKWILSNLASQQNLFRTLDGLTTITGDPKYRQAAMEAIEYAFANLRSPNGLIYWGNVTAYDAKKDNVVGRGKPYSHVLKSNLPHYELMWQVNPEATKNFIESFWSAHVKDWSNLAMDRIASFTDVLEEPWKHTYTDGRAFLKRGGISFFTTGIDLAYAAAVLSKLSGDKEPLPWAKRLIHRYVRTRHPKTGISYWMYTTSSENVLDSYDSIMRKLVPGTTEFLPSEFPWSCYTNPLYRKTMYGQHMPTPSIPINAQVSNWQSQFLVADLLAEEGNVFNQWALEELTAFGQASYRKEDNTFVPILTDGTNIEGYIVKVTNGMLGPSGAALEPLPGSPSDLWAYAMGYRATNDAFMWGMARNISKGNEFGDIGATSRDRPQLDHTTNCSNPYALLAFLELYRGTGKAELLHMAKRIGDNVLSKRFHKGYFVASKEHVYTKFDAIDSLAFLHLHLALVADNVKIPKACPSLPYFYCSYRGKDWANDNAILYTRTESADPPLSLLEATSLGDIEELKAILSKGTDVDGFESTFFKTALHEAAKAGHKEIVELLIAEDAQIDAKDSWPGLTPLHYAVEGGHIEVVKLLLTKDADIDAKITAYVRTTAYTTGDTPLHSAIRAGHEEIVELLIEKGANVNAKNNDGKTPIEVVGSRNRKDIIDLLKKYGAKSPAQTMRQRFENMSVEEREKLREQLRERFGGGNSQRSQGPSREGQLATKLVHDVAVANISVPSSCVQGDTISVSITVRNQGDCFESSDVKLTDVTDRREVASQSVTLSTKDRGVAEADLILSPTSSGQGNFGWGINICGDINQDGYDDLLIGASLWNENHGRAYLYFGGVDMDGIPDLIFAGEAAGDFLGDGGAALGDVNGDGYDDVIIGARGHSKNDGRVYIFLGGVDMDKEVDVILDGEPGKTGFFSCNCLSIGDVDKDGHADVLVGAGGYDRKRGRVYLYYGGDLMDSSADIVFEGERADDLFGRNATIGQDIDGDGYRDILIGARTAPEGTRNGRAYLFYGGDRNHMDAVCDMTFTPPSYRGHEFGSSLDIYDIDSDGHADVVIGARLGQGAVFVYWGDERDKMDAVADVTILGEDGAQSSLGGDKLFCADFNRDGYGDIAVGAYNWLHQNRIGRTYVYYGGTKTSFDTQPDVIFTGETEGSWFGHDIGGGDFNNDGYTDLVAGAWGYNNKEGRAYVFYAPFENKTDITFKWDTTNASPGKHTLKVEIPPVPGEQNTEDNMKTVTIEVKEPSR